MKSKGIWSHFQTKQPPEPKNHKKRWNFQPKSAGKKTTQKKQKSRKIAKHKKTMKSKGIWRHFQTKQPPEPKNEKKRWIFQPKSARKKNNTKTTENNKNRKTPKKTRIWSHFQTKRPPEPKDPKIDVEKPEGARNAKYRKKTLKKKSREFNLVLCLKNHPAGWRYFVNLLFPPP